ncbi:DUF1778 domain-containing protein [Klebsiella pneumoniae]|uniref:DUF1778 domain-containing protein n=3 Tax=Enterobacteriaceae TaxID=543 RepID=A0AAW9LWK6_KLEAE|nr:MULTISPECIES: DUF1778 domain-containing protein [Enterobacteriaceae]HBL0172456.1 DUF1778 domain-containing protein [Escherichia coli]HBM7597588.1 DUF1778 domain-containing protein [Enterobacter hormaechei subsp. xiangfangensis]EIX9107007.1 DUF1778 domain-containing protein [Klebsiella pneumoniae]EIX9149548.1 DUF1778 domain-containing protein [Klebsiella pneumoniae]EKL0985156.1 DUF1778 domain-containing protein [Klebsiella aerogenes]
MKPDIREAPINIRAKTSQRDLIDMAANLVSKSRTDFMLEVACREAQDILLDQRLFLLDDNQFNAFVEELDAPMTPERQARIDNLMSRKSPWD